MKLLYIFIIGVLCIFFFNTKFKKSKFVVEQILGIDKKNLDTKIKKKHLKKYTKPDFFADTINLEVDIRKDVTIVTNVTRAFRAEWAKKNAPLILSGQKQKLKEIKINGKTLKPESYNLKKEQLIVPNINKFLSEDDFTITVVSEIKPQNNTSLKGLYKAEEIYSTQCEPNGFSSITYFFDRPDVMSKFTTKIIADKKYPVLLSNGDKIDQGSLPDNRHFAVWQDENKKPSYLFAMVVGDLKVRKDTFITNTGKKVALEIYTLENDFPKTEFAMQALKRAMAWDEQVYGREYDLETYMIVGVPKFNSGAMENKGLNIFNNVCILATPETATDSDYSNIDRVIAHEYFHNWTGNRITLRDWFQLTLKEGLTVFRDQEFIADHYSSTVGRIENFRGISGPQFKEDRGPLSHPIKPHFYVEMDNFYTSTVYEKGAEVVRMVQTILSKKMFFKGMELYFERYDGQAVTCEDFIKVMEEASGIDLTQFKRWYDQSGTPTLEIRDSYNHGTHEYSLFIDQKFSKKTTGKKEENEPFYIPLKVGLIDMATGKELSFDIGRKKYKEHVLIVKDRSAKFVFQNVKAKPIPSLLRDFSAPVKLEYPYSDEQLLFLFAHDKNGFNKWRAGQTFSTKLLLQLIQDIKAKKELSVSEKFIESVKMTLFNKALDKAVIAESIALPSVSALYEEVAKKDAINPDFIHKARKFLLKTVGTKLKKEFLAIYNELNEKLKGKKYSLSKDAIASRKLRNTCLAYLYQGDEKLGIMLAKEQLKNANNLTDRILPLYILIGTKDNNISQDTTEVFYKDWKHENLIVYKWINAQVSSSEREDSIERVKALMKHESFDISDPNKVFALFGGFVGNRTKFHAEDGTGYKLLVNVILELDKSNPKIAAVFIRCFSDWRRFEPKRSKLMKESLKKLQKTPSLSKNSREVVESSLSQNQGIND
jgi:aminopeptidase N